MTQDAVRLKAVLDAPDDDVPRLAYADWFDDQTDEESHWRGEFISIQIALSNMDPERIGTGQAFGVQQRIGEILDRFGATWTSELSGFVESATHQRGFVGWVKMTARDFLDHGAHMFAVAPIRHLDLTDVRDVDEGLANSPLLDQLHSLSMNGCGLHDVHMQMLAASSYVTNLRWLCVVDNHLGLAAGEALAGANNLPNLKYAEFGGNPFDPVEQEGLDSGIVVASWLSDEGLALEARFGHQQWLHRDEAITRFQRP